jgi:hypothetical protein
MRNSRFILAVAAVFCLLVLFAKCAHAQQVLSGSANVFSNAQTTAAIPLTSSFQTGQHQMSVTHGGLLATTNFTFYAQVGLVDALTGVTNWTTIAQSYTAPSTNPATDTVTFTNYTLAAQARLVMATTNAMNLPNSVGAATLVTNTIILNY